MGGTVNNIMYTIEEIVETKRRRHILGGILLSLSVLLGGLALTVITIKEEKNYYEEDD